jgi:hypothetical protein
LASDSRADAPKLDPLAALVRLASDFDRSLASIAFRHRLPSCISSRNNEH